MDNNLRAYFEHIIETEDYSSLNTRQRAKMRGVIRQARQLLQDLDSTEERGWSPRADSPLSGDMDSETASVSDTFSSTSIESEERPGGRDRETRRRLNIQLSQEEDPGPGVVSVKVSGSSTIHEIDKRLIAWKSLYFRSYLARFHEKEKLDIGKTVELEPDIVSELALEVIKAYLDSNRLDLKNGLEAFEVLEAANYLKIESLEPLAEIQIKKYIDKRNVLDILDKYVEGMGNQRLGSYISSTIIKPAENARRRKYGKFDLTLKLGPLEFRCHKAVLAAASDKMKTELVDLPTGQNVINATDIGVTAENSQHAFNLLDLIYVSQDLSFSSVEDALSVLKILEDLRMSPKYFQTCYTYLSKEISVENVEDVLIVGKTRSNQELVNIALFFIMFKIKELREPFLKLDKEDAIKVIGHSYLNIENELDVALLALDWIKENDQVNNGALLMLEQVRWALISTFEKSHIINNVVSENERLKNHIVNLCRDSVSKDPRCWPQLLLLAETVDTSSKTSAANSNCGHLLHSYDPETKRWAVMGKQNLNSSHQSGHIGVARTQYDTLVFTTVKSSKEKMIYHKMPFNISVYNFWTDTWSFPYAEEEDSKTPMAFGRSHNLVSLNGSTFAAFKDVIGSRDHDVLSLWSVQGAASDSPVYSTTHVNCDKKAKRLTSPLQMFTVNNCTIFDRVNIVDQLSLYSYHPPSNTWTKSQIQGDTVSSSWISLKDGRILQVGGVNEKTDIPSRSCALFSSLDEEPCAIGDLVRRRVQPSLAEFKGLVFAAGGLTQSKKRKTDSDTWDSDLYGGQAEVVEASVEFYVPEVDCWNLLPSQPKVTSGAQLSLVRVDKPMRLMELVFPSSHRGLKRSHNLDE